MNRDNAEIVAGLIDRINKLEKSIFSLQSFLDKDSYKIFGYDSTNESNVSELILNKDEISTVVFNQDIVQLYIDTLNLELNELVRKLEEF